MERFKTDVKLFVLNERAEGKGWKIIKSASSRDLTLSRQQLGQCRNGSKSLNREALKAEIMKDIKEQMPAIEAEARWNSHKNYCRRY